MNERRREMTNEDNDRKEPKHYHGTDPEAGALGKARIGINTEIDVSDNEDLLELFNVCAAYDQQIGVMAQQKLEASRRAWDHVHRLHPELKPWDVTFKARKKVLVVTSKSRPSWMD